MAEIPRTQSKPISSTPYFKRHMDSRTPEENHEWEQARLLEAREKALQEEIGQLDTPRPLKTRMMLAREAANVLQAKKPVIVDISDSGGVADMGVKTKATTRKPVSMHIPEGEAMTYISMKAKLKRNETNIVDLSSDEDAMLTSEKFSPSIYGAKNITTKLKPAGVVHKLLPQHGGQQMYSRERATNHTKLAGQALNAKVKLESEAKEAVIIDLVSDEDNMSTLPRSKNLFTPSYGAGNITKKSDPTTETEKLRLQMTQREIEARQKIEMESMVFKKMMKAMRKGKEEGIAKMAMLKLGCGTQNLHHITTPSYGVEKIMKESGPPTEEEKVCLQMTQQEIDHGQLSGPKSMVVKEVMRAKGAGMGKFEVSMLDIGGGTMDYDTTKYRYRANSITNEPTTKDILSPAPLATEANDLRAEVSELRVKMRAFTTAEEEKFAEEDRLEEEERKKEADKWCGGGWVLL